MEAGGVPVGTVLFDLEAGCPVSVLPRFVTLPFYWSYILPQKTSKTERTGNPQQSCSRSRCRGESRKRKPSLPRLLSLRVWLLTVPLVLFVVRLGPRGPSEVQELSPGPCHVARTAPGQHSLVWFLIMTVMGARSEPGRGGEKVARVGVGSMRPLLFLLGPPSLQPQAPHGRLLSGRLLHMRQEKVPCSLAPLLLRWRTCKLPGPGPRIGQLPGHLVASHGPGALREGRRGPASFLPASLRPVPCLAEPVPGSPSLGQRLSASVPAPPGTAGGHKPVLLV